MKKDIEGKMKIAVTTTRDADESLNYKAKGVSKDLNISYIKRGNFSIKETILKDGFDYLLVVERDKIVIKGEDSALFWHPNMSELKVKSIRQGNKEAIIEATKLEEGNSILDCTLGLAGDSLVFSAVVGEKGYVVGTEINKYIAYLSKCGLENYNGVNGKNINNIKVVNESYEDYILKQRDNSFDVVYFDPMFKEPNRKSTSINSFRDFADHKGLTKDILAEALRVCSKRVVIKERQGSNDFEKLGIEKYYGGKKSGSIIYGVIEKNI
ncbi:putative methyltransferase [Clostridium beijerinckii]|nr:class I SAM-dependent methyltransferase [Clostridium beijerinckii]NRT01864.1 putative methyltransferase [Clostridium beijerinckii]NRT40019.1 putative methyltransferase [Clostridium beijerinckii]NRU08211.1 putative methyltransferase [Clostridium beijerinckii]NRU11636.1 putative methyltransferase [Clostridium beijerinckii]NRU77655.1 putative methyltransferase [Clostridium beijerinckii]